MRNSFPVTATSSRITAKPTSPHRSPVLPWLAAGDHHRDYLNAKQTSPGEKEALRSVSPSHRQQAQHPRLHLPLKRANEDKEIQRALEEEASAMRNGGKEFGESQSSHSPGKAVHQDAKPGSETVGRKWYKIPLASPLAVSGVS